MKADGASAGRKPWRYYYMMALPLTGNSIAPDKLQEMTEMTAAIEQREEKYLRKMAARNAAHAATLEAERRAREEKQPTMSSHIASVLRKLFVLSVVLLLLIAILGCVLYWKHDGHERVPQKLANVVALSAVVLLLKDIVGWVAAYRGSVNGARATFVLGVALIIALALILDEIIIVRRSHNKLLEALAQSEDVLSQDTLDLILNGGEIPSLAQRFVFDAPSVFLQWLSVHCSGSLTKLGYASVAIDRRDFFSPLWNDSEKVCVDTTLRSCEQFNGVIEAVIIGELVLISMQVLLTGMFLVIYDPVVSEKTSKRRRKLLLPTVKTSSSDLSAILTRLLAFGAALFGSSNAIASTDLLHFCSIADFHTLFTWVMIVCLLSGLSAILAALFIGCGWKQQLAGILLVIAVGCEVFMLAEFIKIAAGLIGPDTDQMQTQELRELYMKASAQTCSSIDRWISHVCVGMNSSQEPVEFDVSCQHEFVALLVVTFNFANSYLSWSIGVKLALLVQLILSPLRKAIGDMVTYMCCLSSRDDSTVSTVENIMQQSPPPLGYEEALETYLTSMKVRDPDRIASEREAFKKEWSVRTGRVLSDVRTPRVVISASDFSAIVRTLMLRRLTTICKLDVSLSVSEDGQLLLVRIFASDNLLLATLCETESYRLQFADAIDPGRSFWRDKKEVNTDLKVLDASTVKHKLRLLLAENAMSQKEGVWFPGESLTRVSARVHALSRISRASKGLIRCRNSAPAFASYSPNIQRQFIYKKYPHKIDIPDTYRRSAVLRTVDCIRVTRRIIDAEFDTNATIGSGLLSSLHCLHSSSRFDFNSRAALASSWIKFWRPVHLPGEFYPDDRAVLNLIGRIAPFRQPLQDVRDYFGEKIGFNFAWLAFYGKMMAVPVIIAVAVLASETKHSLMTSLWNFYIAPSYLQIDNTEGAGKINATIALPELILGAGVIAWSFVLAKLWERRSVWHQLQWGVAASNIDSFQLNDDIQYEQSLCSSLHRQLGSWLCVLVLGGGNLLVTLALLLSQGLLAEVLDEKLAVLISCTCQALLTQWNGACIPFVAHALSKWESPHYSRDHPGYQSSYVAKLFTLQLFNTFTGVILVMLSSIGGLSLLVHVVAPLDPLYISYNSTIKGHVGIFIQMETLLIAIFAVQLSIRVFLILSTSRRFHLIQREGQSRQYEEETMLSPYPGPDKDYAQIVMQLGLVVMFSSVCPLLPSLALVDCAVKIRQNALEVCCIRQRPEPEEGDGVGLRLWASYTLLMIRLAVPVALSIPLFTADNFADVSIERRVGYWLIGVLSVWLTAQLLWFLIPRESRTVEEARARNFFLVERYFGHAEVHEQKTSPTNTSDRYIEKENISLQETAPSVEQSLHHYEERLELLHRLNVALRKRDDLGGAVPLVNMAVPTQNAHEQKESEEGMHETHGEKPAPFRDEDESQHRDSKSSEEMIVGYFRPVRSMWPPSSRPTQQEGTADDKATTEDIVESSEERTGSASREPLTIEGVAIGETIDEGIANPTDSGGESAPPVSPVLLSKLFTRMPTFPSTFVPSTASEEADATLLPASTSPFVSASLPQVDIDPGVFAPTEVEIINRESSNDEELLEEKKETPAFIASAAAVESPRKSLLSRIRSRKSKSPVSTHSEDDSQVDAGERSVLRQLSPRLSILPRKSKRSSSKVSDSEESKINSSVVHEPPVPRRLSKLFKRAQPPSSSTSSSSNPPVVTNIEAEDRVVDPVAFRHDQFAFLYDTHEEQSSPPTQRRHSSSRSARPPSPPPVYTRVDLSGLEAVIEAANRRHFDFSADEQAWEE